MNSAVLFDLDGTLIHLPIDYKKFRKFLGITDKQSISNTCKERSVAFREALFAYWTKLEFEALPSLTSNQRGMYYYQLLEEYRYGLVTMQGRKVVEAILAKLNLHFEVIITREDSLDRTEQLHIALQKLKVKPALAMFIADGEKDYKSSQELQCIFVKV